MTSAAVILFIGGIIVAGVYGWNNTVGGATLKDFIAALYGRIVDVYRAGHMSGLQVPNDGPVPPGTSINVESIKAIRSLLLERNFEKLNALLENYEKTLGVKDDLIDVYNAFNFSDPQIEGILSEWVDKFPSEYRPYLARGTYYVNMGYVSRGTKYAKDTTKEQFENMNRYFSLARQDIDKALRIKNDILVPYYVLLRMSRAADDMSKEEELEILKKGLAINPASFRLRAYYLLGITPRWGGSYEQMDAFATEAQSYAANNPKIACLRGYAYYDAGDMKIINHDYTAAFALLNKAMTYGKDPLFLRDRASVYGHMQKPAEALKDIDLAIALYPNDVEEYFIRAELLGTQGRLEEALRDIETGDSIESNKPESERHKRWVSDMLTYSGYQLLQKKDVQGAMGMFNLAVRIGPENESAYYCRAMAYVNKNDMDTAYSDLQKAIELKPDYFKAYYYLDNYVLSKRKDWVKIISYWDKYIALHPEDARAYVERSGAYYYSHNLEAALRDAKHAADLGNENGKRIYEKYKKGVKMD